VGSLVRAASGDPGDQGDDLGIGLPIGLAVLAAAALGFTVLRRRER
jgi:hypothetical protein